MEDRRSGVFVSFLNSFLLLLLFCCCLYTTLVHSQNHYHHHLEGYALGEKFHVECLNSSQHWTPYPTCQEGGELSFQFVGIVRSPQLARYSLQDLERLQPVLGLARCILARS